MKISAMFRKLIQVMINQFKFTLIFVAIFMVVTFFIKEIFQYFVPLVHITLSVVAIVQLNKTRQYTYLRGVASSLKVAPLGLIIAWGVFFSLPGLVHLIARFAGLEITQDASGTTLGLVLDALPGLIAEIIKLIPISFIIPIFFIFFNKKTAVNHALDADLNDENVT